MYPLNQTEIAVLVRQRWRAQGSATSRAVAVDMGVVPVSILLLVLAFVFALVLVFVLVLLLFLLVLMVVVMMVVAMFAAMFGRQRGALFGKRWHRCGRQG